MNFFLQITVCTITSRPTRNATTSTGFTSASPTCRKTEWQKGSTHWRGTSNRSCRLRLGVASRSFTDTSSDFGWRKLLHVACQFLEKVEGLITRGNKSTTSWNDALPSTETPSSSPRIATLTSGIRLTTQSSESVIPGNEIQTSLCRKSSSGSVNGNYINCSYLKWDTFPQE